MICCLALPIVNYWQLRTYSRYAGFAGVWANGLVLCLHCCTGQGDRDEVFLQERGIKGF